MTTPHDAATRFRDPDAARLVYGAPLVDRVITGCFAGDPAADAVVSAFRTLPGGEGFALLEQALAGGVDALPASAPDELAELLRPLEALPAWVDPARLDRGATAYWRAGAQALSLSLTCGALAFGYQSASLSRPLAATGRLERMVPRRVAETARWVLDVTTPGGMLPGAPGFTSSVRVRLVHALVRAHLRRGAWDEANWGVPISAADAASTAMGGFLTVHIEAMHDLGIHYSRRELEDMTHLWAWIATVMGVPPALAPPAWRDARRQVHAALAIDAGPDEHGAVLVDALLRTPTPAIRALPGLVQGPLTAVSTQVLIGFTRRWMGDEMADRLGVGRSPLTHAALVARPLNLARGLVVTRLPAAGQDRVGALERALVRRTLDQGRAARAPLTPSAAAAAPVVADAA